MLQPENKNKNKLFILLLRPETNTKDDIEYEKIADRRKIAITNVIEATVLTIEATNVGEVYLKLAKYIFRVRLILL